jgi:hypothetical protein
MDSTYFAPAGRAESGDFARRVAAVENAQMLRKLVDAMPGMVMILSPQRQVVAANVALTRTLGMTADEVLAKRPGEVVGCIWASEGPDGCGTGRHCSACGAVEAILESQQSSAQVVRECRVSVQAAGNAQSLDLRVTATPLVIDGEQYVIAVLDDISQQKRLEVLNRVFFHDVLNTAGCLWGYARCWRDATDGHDELSDLHTRFLSLTDQLLEEIKGQQDLLGAESGELVVRREPVDVLPLLESLRDEYQQHPVAQRRRIELRDVWQGRIATDVRLVRRVLGNMIKNALEATGEGRTVSLRCLDLGHEVMLAVHNCEVMPDAVQFQIFQRSFSTKAQRGRGIGAYSMKLLGERYLGGRVEFTSGVAAGTTFTLTLPKDDPAAGR